MKKLGFFAFAMGFFMASFLHAVTINSVTYKGMVHLSELSASEISGLKKGAVLTDESSNKAIKALFAQGYFKDIFIEENNGDVIVNLKEKPVIARIDIKGVVSNDEKAIANIIGIKKGQMYDERAINLAKMRVRQFYEAKGFFDTIVGEDTTNLNDENSVHVTFRINRGENITIKKVNLIGAKILDYSDIEPFVDNKQKEALGWMWGFNDGAVKIFSLPQDSDKIREQYFKRGYLDANISRAYLNTYFDSYTADLSYYIQEGERYKVGEITIDIPDQIGINEHEILKSLKLERGDTFNTLWLKRDQEKISDLVANKGYAYARVYPQTTPNELTHSVDINYQILPNEKVYIRNVIISGNTDTLDRVIRRELYLTEGNLYSRIDLKDSKNALKRTGYFEDVDIIEKQVSPDEVDLEVVVKETNTGSISGGIGYSTGDGLLISAGVSENNLFGSGYQGAVSIDKSDDKLNGRLSLTNPRVYDSPYSLGGSVYGYEYKWDEYTQNAYGSSISLGRQLGRYTNAFINYHIQHNKISGIDAFYKDAGYLNGKHWKSAITPSISWNNTDDFYLPRSGFIASTALEIAGLGGDEKFVKSTSDFNIYQGLEDYIGMDLILRYKATFSYLWNNDENKLPINEKLFLGGLGSVRGFDAHSLSPKKRICNPIDSHGLIVFGCEDIKTGGKMAFSNSIELSFPIINRIKMRGLVFADFGSIGQEKISEIHRTSIGAGIEWVTILGPLQVIFAKPLDDKKGDETSKFEFSIGKRF